MASIGVVTPASATQKPADVDVAEAAELAADVRAEIRKPIG
ncbi:hypothetical protein [Streptomyces sp. NPDC001415]